MQKLEINFNNSTKKDINLIADYFKHGKVVVYPTDTIYGIGCIATDKKAIKRIYKIKKRDKKKPLLVLIGSYTMLKKYCVVSRAQMEFLKKEWRSPVNPPAGGEARSRIRPVSVILWGRKNLPKDLSGSSDSLAVRFPKNKFLLKVLRKVGAPIVSTSLNISGQENLTEVDFLDKIFGNKIDLIVDSGKKIGKSSRLIDLRDIKNVKILR